MVDTPEQILRTYRIDRTRIYIVGLFAAGVTVLSQQSRALNLAWALVESGEIQTDSAAAPASGKKQSIAIVGGGFAGITIAAALIKKRAYASITIFERRDTLLPLQRGSDTRWLHPNIYNWPAEGSEVNSAMLPIMNWSAARASDVAFDVMEQWNAIASEADDIRVVCNAAHLRIDEAPTATIGHEIEWIGERRSADASSLREVNNEGGRERFDVVVLATGFGLEKDGAKSYWRNDMIGQPKLDQATGFIVSGQGDGAVIDLFRVKIANYRQDRILSELIDTDSELFMAVDRLYARFGSGRGATGLFRALSDLETSVARFGEARDRLRRRLRRDTDAYLRLKTEKIDSLFDDPSIRMSFQNRLLLYFLFRCGGFMPINDRGLGVASKRLGVGADQIVVRHGTDRVDLLNAILGADLSAKVVAAGEAGTFEQVDQAKWPGGYFGYHGKEATAAAQPSDIKKRWRVEYLPGPTQLVASTLCANVAGLLRGAHAPERRLRVTIHRAMMFGRDEVLQQCCEYAGIGLTADDQGKPGRTFPALNATIGAAYRTRRIIRSRRGATAEDLTVAMNALDLNTASSAMSGSVRFLLAIPVLEPERDGGFIKPTPVAAVVYVDSTDEQFYVDDEKLDTLIRMIDQCLVGFPTGSQVAGDGIRNVPTVGVGAKAPTRKALPRRATGALDILTSSPPRSERAFQFNFEYSDFIPVRTRLSH